MRVRVYHNIDPDHFFGYQPGHAVVPVFTADIPTEEWNPDRVLEQVFHLLNVGDDPEFGTPDPRAVAYRQRRNRSLSVGDVVWLDDIITWRACARVGWTHIDPPTVVFQETHGTTPLTPEETLGLPEAAQ
jgi:hypothetical protein